MTTDAIVNTSLLLSVLKTPPSTKLVQAEAPIKLAKRKESAIVHCSRRPTIKPATNASPAPETSTTSTGNAGASSVSCALISNAPSSPLVMIAILRSRAKSSACFPWIGFARQSGCFFDIWHEYIDKREGLVGSTSRVGWSVLAGTTTSSIVRTPFSLKLLSKVAMR